MRAGRLTMIVLGCLLLATSGRAQSIAGDDGVAFELSVLKANARALLAMENQNADNSPNLLQRLGEILGAATNHGWGGNAAFTSGIAVIDIAAVKDRLAAEEARSGSPFQELHFDLSGQYEVFGLFGGEVLFGKGNGLRTGGFGKGGARTYTTMRSDTTFATEIAVGYGGLLLEKAFVRGNSTFRLGGGIGGGAMTVSAPSHDIENDVDGISGASAKLGKETSMKEEHSAAEEGQEGSSDESDKGDDGLSAGLIVGEIRLGYTYTIKKWIHLGISGGASVMKTLNDNSLPGSMKEDYTNSIGAFTTFNPCLEFKVVLGNLG